MNITLKPDQEQFIQEKFKSGHYQTADEVIGAALKLLGERDRQHQQWLSQTREQVDVGLAELNRGEKLDGEAIVAEIPEKPSQPFPETTLRQVAGCLKYQGQPKSLEELEAAISQGIQRQWHDCS